MRGWQPGRVRRLLHADRPVLVVSLPTRLLAIPRIGDVFAVSDNNLFRSDALSCRRRAALPGQVC
jgi:hypothetical protein